MRESMNGLVAGRTPTIVGLQPIERPGMRDWERLPVPGLLPTLRDYQRKVGSTVHTLDAVICARHH